MSFDVCVIGAGIVGLSVALNVQRLMRYTKVTIIADNIGGDTNTPVTRSLFVPAPTSVKSVDPEISREWFLDGWNHHLELAMSPEAAQSGNTLKSGHCIWWECKDYIIEKSVLDYRRLSREEMDSSEYKYAHGCEFTTVHIDVELYLRWLLKEIRKNGVDFILDRTFSLQELYGKYDAVVNCVGKRGREIQADEHLQFLCGKMLQTTPIDEDRFFLTQDSVYVCPNHRTGLCDVGFIWEKTSVQNELNTDDEWLILHRAQAYVPQLKTCQVVKRWVERRPDRSPSVPEIEFLNCGGPILPVVQNCQSGENSVSVAWGRGVQAAHLVQEIRRMTRPFARVNKPFNTV